MSSKKIASILVALVASIALFTFGPARWAPVAEAIPSCDDASLSGTFSYRVAGVADGGGPVATVGTFTSDGAGTITGRGVSAEEGLLSMPGDFVCSPYTMTPECTFNALCVDVGEVDPDVRIDGALDDGRKEVQLMVTQHPSFLGAGVASGVARKQ
jgi:hypothetical protein